MSMLRFVDWTTEQWRGLDQLLLGPNNPGDTWLERADQQTRVGRSTRPVHRRVTSNNSLLVTDYTAKRLTDFELSCEQAHKSVSAHVRRGASEA